MLEPCKFPSPNSWQRRFLWTHKEVGPVLHPVIGFAFQVGAPEEFPSALSFKSLDPSFQSQQAGSMYHSHGGGWRRQAELRGSTKNVSVLAFRKFPTGDPIRETGTSYASACFRCVF